MEVFNNIKNQIILNKLQIYLVLYLFIFLYAPPVLVDFNIVFILFIFSVIKLCKKYRSELNLFLKNITVKRFLIGIIIYTFYFIIIILYNYFFAEKVEIISYLTILYSYFLFFPITLTCSAYVICFCSKNKLCLNDLIKCFIIACLIQSGIAILSLIFRNFKEMLLIVMYNHTGNDLLLGDWLNHRRFFGFSRNLLDSFGLGTGLICGLCILQIQKSKHYIFFVPFIFLLTFLNAKTGIVIIGVSIILFLFNKKNRQILFSLFLKYKYYILISMVILFFCIYFFSPNTFNWILNDFLSFIPGTENDGIANLLFSENFWILPDKILNILFGTGHNIYNVQGFPHSDVGYINEIWKTGLIGFIILYGSIVYLFHNLTNSKIYVEKYIGFLFLISIFLFMIKGQIIGYNPATPLIFTVGLYAIYKKDVII